MPMYQCKQEHGTDPWSFQALPSGIRDVDSPKVDALATHNEECGKAQQRHAAADHRQLGRLPSAELELLNDVATQDDAHAGTGYDDHSWKEKKQRMLMFYKLFLCILVKNTYFVWLFNFTDL